MKYWVFALGGLLFLAGCGTGDRSATNLARGEAWLHYWGIDGQIKELRESFIDLQNNDPKSTLLANLVFRRTAVETLVKEKARTENLKIHLDSGRWLAISGGGVTLEGPTLYVLTAHDPPTTSASPH